MLHAEKYPEYSKMGKYSPMNDVYPINGTQTRCFPQLEDISPMKDVPQWKMFP